MTRYAVLLPLLAAPLCAQPCLPHAPVSAAFDEMDRAAATAATPERVWQDGLTRLRAAHPGDFHVALAEIRRLRGSTLPRIRDEVEARYRSAAPEPPARLLEAFAWIGDDTPKAIAAFRSLKQEHPKLVWAEFGLAYIHTFPAFRQPEAVATHLLAFAEACPEALDAYELLPRVDLPAHAARFAALLRPQLESARTLQALRLWPVLWAQEFKAKLPDARERVAADLPRIQEKARAGMELDRVRLQAARLTGDMDTAREIQTRLNRQMEDRMTPPAMRALSEWLRANPQPPSWEPGARRAWARRSLEFIDQLPDPAAGGFFVLSARAQRLAEIPDREANEVRAAGERALALLDAERAGLSPQNYYRIVEAYLERPELHGLIPESLDTARNIPPPAYRASDLLPQSRDDETVIQRSARLERQAASLYRAELAAMQGDEGQSERHLAEFVEALDRERPAPGSPALRGDPYPQFEMRLYETRSRIALRAGQKRAAALWLRRGSLALVAGRPTGGPHPSMDRALDLWRHSGGTDSEWAALGPAAPVRPPRVEIDPRERAPGRAFPEFELSDTGGRAWSLATLKGRPALINIWATWCGPCLLELPEIEKLHRALAQSGEAIVLTLNLDDNPGVIEPFLREKGYTFPVIPARAWVEERLPPAGIPRNLLIDARGQWAKEFLGFDPKGWLERMRDALAVLK